MSDVIETTVSVVEDYHGEASGSVDEGESDQIEFPVESGAVSLYITWSLYDNQILGGSSVNLILKDSQGNDITNETGVEEGDGSLSFSDESLHSVGQYVFIIECEEGNMGYDVTIDVSY